MILLAIDTSTPVCRVAVTSGETMLSELRSDEQCQHTEGILVLIKRALAQAGCAAGDLGCIAVATGPGMFTGLRVGISTAQGLALALDKPLVGVPTLEIIARQAGSAAWICPMMDARRGQVYTCLYHRVADDLFEQSKEYVVIEADVWAARLTGTVLFAGSGALRYRRQIEQAFTGTALFGRAEDGEPRTTTLARIAAQRLPDKQCAPYLVVPQYVRPPDAKEPSR